MSRVEQLEQQIAEPDAAEGKELRAWVELYDLAADRNETTNVADQHPDRVRELSELMKREHVPSKPFPMRGLDGNSASTEE